MSSGELSFESSPFLRARWNIPEFFRLATGFEYSLQSLEFTFVDGRYCLRLLPTIDVDCYPIGIELLNLSDTDPGRAVLYEVELRSRAEECSLIRPDKNSKIFGISQSILQRLRNLINPGGTLTVLCSVRLRKPSSAGSPKSSGAQTQVAPKCKTTGNLSFQTPPFLYVTWRIPGIFQLSRESEYTLQSPEFPFSDRRYCLQLFPNRNRLVIKLRNLTDMEVPGRYVSYEVGLKSTSGKEIDIDYYDTSIAREFYILQSELDKERYSCFSDGHLTVFCSIRSREPNSAASPKFRWEEEDKKELSGISKLLSDLRQLLQTGADSDVCLVVRDKEFRAHKNILRARSPVFDAMFAHEAAEEASGRVVIDDLDPHSFGDFLEYLYTGSVGAGLSRRNVFWLYKAADKFDVSTLKSECVAHMRTRSAFGSM